MITWRRKKLEAQDEQFFADGKEVNRILWESMLSAQERVKDLLPCGFERVTKERHKVKS